MRTVVQDEHGVWLTQVNSVGATPVSYGAPLWCKLTNQRVRFNRMVDGSTVEVLDNDGVVLPDWRHVSQVEAY